MTAPLNVKTVPGQYAVAQLPPHTEIPTWATGHGFVSVSLAEDEITIVCLQERVPEGLKADRDWACLRTIGPFDFDAAGIVHSLISPLSANGIGVFVVCTFDGEHLLVANKDLEKAKTYLINAGHILVDADYDP